MNKKETVDPKARPQRETSRQRLWALIEQCRRKADALEEIYIAMFGKNGVIAPDSAYPLSQDADEYLWRLLFYWFHREVSGGWVMDEKLTGQDTIEEAITHRGELYERIQVLQAENERRLQMVKDGGELLGLQLKKSERLFEALRKYGTHHPGCRLHDHERPEPFICTCGLDDALEEGE